MAAAFLISGFIFLFPKSSLAKYYHLTNAAGPSSSYQMFDTVEASGTRVDTSFCTASTGAAKIGTVAWITPTGTNGFPSDTNINGTWYFSMQVTKLSGASSQSNLFAKVYRYSDSSLLFTTGNSANFTATTYPVAWSYTASGVPIISAGDRIYVEFWNNCTDAAPGFNFSYNSYDFNAYMNMPVLSADLKVTSSDITFSNNTPNLNDSITISETVTNEGGWYSNGSAFANYGSGGDTNVALYNGQWLAQSFTVASTLYLSKASLYVIDGGTSDTMTVEIQTNSGGNPSGTKVSGTGTYTINATLNFDWWDVEIQPPVSLAAGTYWLVAKNTNAALENGYGWYDDSNGGTGNGTCRFSTNQGTSWSSCGATDELYYRAYSANQVAVNFYDGAPPTTQIGATQNLAPIGPGNSGTANVTWTATPAGAHTIYADVDYPFPGSITEIIEDTNNEATKAITVYSAPNIVINEFMADPASVADASGEWFEVYNSTNSTVDINGWVIKSAGDANHTIANGGPLNITAHGYLVLCNNSNSATNGGFTCNYQYSGIVLNNNTDDSIIINNGVSDIDTVNFGPTYSLTPVTGKSYELKNEVYDNNLNPQTNWVAAPRRGGTYSAATSSLYDKGSPGAANVYKTSPGVASGALVINELMVDPSCVLDTAGEYIELQNTTASPIDIDGFKFKDLVTDNFTVDKYFNSFNSSTIVPANGYYVLGRNSTPASNGNYTPDYVYTNMDLNNTGTDTVQIYDYQDVLLSTVTYSVTSPWPTLTAGTSFELKNPFADSNDGSNWGNNTVKNPGTYCDMGTPKNANSNYSVVNPSWTASPAGALDFQSSPIIRTGPSGATVYMGNNDGKFYAFNASTGAQRWAAPYNAGSAIKSQPNLYYDGTNYLLYFGAENGSVYALKDSGASVATYSGWSTNPLVFTSAVRSSPIRWTFAAAPTQRLFFGTNDTKIYSVDAATGATVTGWPSASLNAVVTSTPALPGDNYVYMGTWGGKVYQMDYNDGTVLKSSTSFTKITGSPSIRYEKLYIATWDPLNALKAIQVTPTVPATNMNVLWTFASAQAGDTLQEFEGTPFVSGNFIYAGNNNGKIYKVNRGDFTLTSGWKYPSSSSTLGAIKTSPVLYNGKIYFGSEDGKFYCLVDSTGALCAGYPYNTGAAIRTTPAILPSAGIVVVGNASGSVFAFPL